MELAPDDLSPRQEERNTTAALVRGMAAAFARRGILWQGFDAWVESDVLPGSGLSSSAAFEVLLGRIGNALFAGNSLTAPDIARMGQWAENVYFGKPCGLMDQLASSTGGLVFMDFRDPAAPLVRRLDAALPGYVLCVVDSGADHAGLTDAYAAIPGSWGPCAACSGRRCCARWRRRNFTAACRRSAGPPGTGRCCGPSMCSTRTAGCWARCRLWKTATRRASWPWSTTPAAPPGNICRTSPRRGPPGIRSWP